MFCASIKLSSTQVVLHTKKRKRDLWPSVLMILLICVAGNLPEFQILSKYSDVFSHFSFIFYVNHLYSCMYRYSKKKKKETVYKLKYLKFSRDLHCDAAG